MRIYHKTMEKKCSAWVLCPSKRFPGLYYYFNTQTGEKAWSWTVPAGQTPDGKPEEKSQPKASFGQVEFPKYLHNHAINPRKNYAPQCNTNTPNVIGTGPSFTPRSRESEQQVTTTSHTNFKLAPAQFKAIPNNPFSLRFPEALRTDSRQVCEGNASKKSVFEPIFTNTFFNVVNERQKRRSNMDIEELSQAMKKAKISSTPSCPSEQDTPEWNSDEVNYHITKCDDGTASLITQYPYILRQFRDENVKVCINFLRNLSMSENTDTWYLVPDVEVLLDNFNFLKKFIAGDQTCSVMTPATVLAKLQFLRDNCRAVDSRATVAGQVIQWLTKNSVCQSDKSDECSLDDLTIHKEIVEYCKEVNMFHVVIITKSKNLYDQAKRNDIHAYYLNALKIINQAENLFLLDPNNTNTFKWPTTTSANNVFNRKQNALKNLEIRVNRNGERSLVSHSFDEREISNVFEGRTNKNKSLENHVRISARNDSILNTTEGFFVEEKITEFSTQHTHLQVNVIKRIDECTCNFLQIMEHCLHNVFKCIPGTQFDPPCWLHEGLQHLKELYSQNKQLCAIVGHLISMCGFRLNNGIMRPVIKSDKFVKILGAGILLIEQLEKILECPELSDCKEMLSDLMASIQTAEEFPAVFSISLECRRILGDEPFRMEGVKSTENGRCNRFISGIERTPHHEAINTETNCNRPELQQNQSELFDVQACGGSIQLFRDDMLDGNISKPNFDPNQNCFQSIDSNQYNTIQSVQCIQNKSNVAFHPNHFNSNKDKTIKSIDSNHYNTIQSIQCIQNKSNAAFQSNNFNSNQDKTILSIDSNHYNTIPTIQCIQNKSNAAFQPNHSNSNQDKTIQSIDSNQYKTIQSKQYIHNKSNAAFQPNHFNSNQNKTIKLIDSNQYNTIQSIQSIQNKSNAAFQSSHFNSNQDKTIQSIDSNYHNTIPTIQCIQNKSNAAFQPNHSNSNQDKTIQSIDSNQYTTIQSKQCIQNKSNAAFQPNHFNSNQNKTIKLIDSNQYNTIQSIQSIQNKSNAAFQSSHFNSNQDKTIQSIDSNYHNTIPTIQCIQNKSNAAFQPNHSNSNQDKTIQSIDSNQYTTIQSKQCIQNKSNAAFQPNHSNSNQDKTIQLIDSNQYTTIQSKQCIQNKSNAEFQPDHFNSDQDNTVRSIDSNPYNTIPTIQCDQNKSNAVIEQNNEEMQVSNNAVNCMTVSSGKQSDNSTSSVILQTIDNRGLVFQKLENTVDMIRHALTRMKLFIEVRMEELKKGAIPERKKECLREKSIRLLDCAAGMFETLKIIQKRENPNDPSFGKKFAVRNPAYTECIEHCLEQVENMHRSFIYLLEALK